MKIFNRFLFLFLLFVLFSTFAFPAELSNPIVLPKKVVDITAASGTYIPTSGTKLIKFRLWGPGGGGSGGANASSNNAGDGANGAGNSTFGSSFAGWGQGSVKGTSIQPWSGSGGSFSVGGDVSFGGFGLVGTPGSTGGACSLCQGGSGGNAPFLNGAGYGGGGGRSAGAASNNTGSGGGGGGAGTDVVQGFAGGGGGSGGYVEGWIRNPNPAGISYTLPAGGSGGSPGTGGNTGTGGAGARGRLIIEEY